MSQFGQPDSSAQQHPDPYRETLDLRSYLRPIWHWKWLVIVLVIAAAGGAYALTSREQKTYTAAALVYVQNADPAAPTSTPPTAQQLADIATLFTSKAITNTVYHSLGLPIGSAGSVLVSPSASSSFVSVAASSHSPVLAARLANAYATAFLASQAHGVTVAEQAAAAAARVTLSTIPASGAANISQRQTLLGEIAADDAAAHNPSPGATVPDPAVAPLFPSSPNPKRDALFAGLIGLLLGVGLAFVLDLADRRLTRVSSVQSVYGQSVIAVLPHVSNARPARNGAALTPPEFIEVMRSLRVNLRLASGGRPLRSVVVTSALPSEGKSTVARDLAFAYADAGERVLLIDCDLRRPSLAGQFSLSPQFGLAHVLRREVTPADAAVGVFRISAPSANGASATSPPIGDPRAQGSIDLIAHGERVDSPAALLSSSTMTELLAAATAHYDIAILDTSPILTVSDAVPLLDQVSCVLFVARLGMTTRQAAERLTDLARRVPDMNLAGIVVNDMRHSYGDEGYSTYSRYGYAYAHPDAERSGYEPLMPPEPLSGYDPLSPPDPAA